MRRLLPLLVAAGVLISGCAAAVTEPPLPADLTGTEWRAESIAGQRAAAEIASTLSFLPDDRIAGTGGCNRYTGAVKSEAGRLEVGPLAGTMMACPPERMAQEQRFLAALEATVRVRRDGPALLLEGPDGTAPTRLLPAG